MKKLAIIILLLITLTATLGVQLAYANMAAPNPCGVAGTITFDKNEQIAVISEVLDIVVKGDTASITANYTMNNTTDKDVTISSMFISSNIAHDSASVTIDDQDVTMTRASYSMYQGDSIEIDQGWSYVLSQYVDLEENKYYHANEVDAITFDMSFAPHQQREVVVSYQYTLGGRPNYPDSNKYGEILYYLTPASMWQDFADITINLTLDKDMPIIDNSNLQFVKISDRTYQYHSDTLPEENLRIRIDQNSIQEFFTQFYDPYFWLGTFITAVYITVVYLMRIAFVATVIITIILLIVYHCKKRTNRH